MSLATELNSVIGPKNTSCFSAGDGATGVALLGRRAWITALPESRRQSLAQAGKSITCLEDGGFQGSAWGGSLPMAPGSRIQRATQVGGQCRCRQNRPITRAFWYWAGDRKDIHAQRLDETEGIVQQEKPLGLFHCLAVRISGSSHGIHRGRQAASGEAFWQLHRDIGLAALLAELYLPAGHNVV